MQVSSPCNYPYPNVVPEYNMFVLHSEYGIFGARNPLPPHINHLPLLLCCWFGPDTKYSLLWDVSHKGPCNLCKFLFTFLLVRETAFNILFPSDAEYHWAHRSMRCLCIRLLHCSSVRLLKSAGDERSSLGAHRRDLQNFKEVMSITSTQCSGLKATQAECSMPACSNMCAYDRCSFVAGLFLC